MKCFPSNRLWKRKTDLVFLSLLLTSHIRSGCPIAGKTAREEFEFALAWGKLGYCGFAYATEIIFRKKNDELTT